MEVGEERSDAPRAQTELNRIVQRKLEKGGRYARSAGSEDKGDEEEEGMEVSSRNLQKYIAAQEAGSNRASSVRREIRVIVERFHGV